MDKSTRHPGPPPPALLPPGARVEPWPAGSCAVWRVDSPSGRCWLKQHRAGRGFAQELQGLGWAAPLPAPRVLGVDEGARALLLSHCPGEPAPLDPAAHRAAGAWLRALHDQPTPDPDPLPLPQALRHRAAQALRRAEPHAPPAALALAAQALGAPGRFATQVRARCHRDYTPQNWLWGPQGLWVLDLEHSHLDSPLADLVKLAGGVWPQAPALRVAFLEGYGPLGPEAAADLQALRWAWALDTLSWGVEHEDAGFEALGREALAALIGGGG